MKTINSYIQEKLIIGDNLDNYFLYSANYELKSINELKNINSKIFDTNLISFIKGNILSTNFNSLYVWDDVDELNNDKNDFSEKIVNYRIEKFNKKYVDTASPKAITNSDYSCILLIDKKNDYAEMYIAKNEKLLYFGIAQK